MAITGDLSDTSLMNLVEFLCLDRRNTALFLSCEGEEGVMYFNCGELIHATTGPLEGDEAVYELLGWTEGAFQVTGYESVPRRTVTTSWNHLVLEGMRRADEKRRGAKTPSRDGEVFTDAEMEQDGAFENHMIQLLSRMEHLRSQMEEAKSTERPARALEILTEIVNHLSAFGMEHLYLDVLAEIVSSVAADHPAANHLQVENNRLSCQIIRHRGHGGDDLGDGRDVLRQVGHAMVKIVDKYFSVIANSFRSQTMGDRWRVACGYFVSDLISAVEKVEY